MINRIIKGKILVFAVFLTGITSGLLIANFYESRVSGTSMTGWTNGNRDQRARHDVSRVHDYLALNEEQREQINKILEETRMEFRKLSQETRPKFQTIEETSRNRIRALLNSEQKAKYEDFLTSRRYKGRGRDFDRPRSQERD